jgi:hypothetical protein
MPMTRKSLDVSYQSSAKVVDGNLVISLPDALTPVVWRMELGSVKASAIEIRALADGTHMLTLKTPKGESHDVAPFSDKDAALRALMRVSEALQNGEGKAWQRAGHANAPAQAAPVAPEEATSGSPLKWLLALGAVMLVIFLIAFAAANTQRPVEDQPMENMATTTEGSPATTSGVPQSADDVLRGN